MSRTPEVLVAPRLPDVLKCLEGGKEFLSTYSNWCPRGSDAPKRCAYVACANEENKLKATPLFEKSPVAFLTEASRELYGDCIIAINDGGEGISAGKTDEERYAMVMKAYDQAIENVRKAMSECEKGEN